MNTTTLQVRTSSRRRLPAPFRGASFAIAAVTLIALVALSLLAPLISPDPNAISVSERLLPPTWAHPLGTDDLGRDILGRLAHAGLLTLGVSLGAAVLSIGLGVVWGMVSAVYRKWSDEVLMRLADAIMAIPVVLLALVFIAAFGTSVASLIVVIGMLQSPVAARIFRAATMTELSADYVRGAVATGASRGRIVFTQLLPNIVPTIIAQAVLNVAGAVVLEASLSFVGLGIQPPQASWGSMLKSGYDLLFQAPWYAIAPAVAIFALLAALTVVGQRLQKYWEGGQS